MPGPIISPPLLRAAGVVLLVALALAYAAPLLRRNGRAGYLDLALGGVSAGALVVAAALATRGRTRDWRGAAAVAAAAGAGYLISRGLGWPGAGGDVDRWRSAVGSAALGTAVVTLAVALAALRRGADRGADRGTDRGTDGGAVPRPGPGDGAAPQPGPGDAV
ncbi:MAG TPA: hypothetical protein VLM05_04880, partial [Mycobacteriales bacterium]|nr:hypothetical protein [Mycobacteriales bacterium]